MEIDLSRSLTYELKKIILQFQSSPTLPKNNNLIPCDEAINNNHRFSNKAQKMLDEIFQFESSENKLQNYVDKINLL